MKYVNVVIDNNTDATDLRYTYAVDGDIKIGQAVLVPFGLHDRAVDAYVVEILDDKPEGVKRIKKISSISDFCLSEEAVNTALWMHTRYLCRYIEAIKCFLPISEAKRKTADPFANIELNPDEAKVLNDEQQKALSAINAALDSKKHSSFLLHGVTGSGKTEVYLQAMQKTIDMGRQGIMLVPEISLTPQIVSRFINRFGRDCVAIIHSKLTPQQRSAEYKRIESGDVKIVIGARSAVFAPLSNIGLIILDEEHESSYKSDKSPKYDTEEVALKRAMQSGGVVVLGSATPSIVDYYRADSGIFKRIEIKNRYNQVRLPSVEIVDMTGEIRSGNRSVFSRHLVDEIEKTLNDKKQVILFLNRRGYNSYVSCRECGYVVKCPECGIAMPYHKDSGVCECHYCGRKIKLGKVCPECGSKLIGGYGVGTQLVEETALQLFPNAVVDRLDLDSIKKKGELEKVLKRFEKKKTDILIGTQLVAKGLDFENVGLVGVVSADVSLNIPDFRSQERTFQLVTQAAGRSGRGSDVGKVIIQTYSPENDALLSASKHDYHTFYDKEIAMRRATGYPPFSDIYQIVIQDENDDKAQSYAQNVAKWIRGRVDEDTSVLGPAAPMIHKINGMHRYQVLIKAPQGSRASISAVIRELKDKHERIKNSAQLLTVDINPFTFI